MTQHALIGHSKPASPTWVVSGTGAAFGTDAAALDNGIVSDVTAVQWLSGAQTTSSVLNLQSTWPVATVVRIIPILGLIGIPAGTKIVVTGKRSGDSGFPYALGGNSNYQRTQVMPDGSIGAWIVCAAGLDPIIGYQIAAYNDVNGSTGITAAAWTYWGNAVALQGFEFNIRDGQLQAGYDGLPTQLQTINNQIQIVPSLPYRTHQSLDTIPLTRAQAWGTSSSTPPSYEALIATLIRGDSIALIPSWDNGTGVLDAWTVHQTAIFGKPIGLQRPQSMGDKFFIAKFGIAESPPGN